jgi:hypothetical protein
MKRIGRCLRVVLACGVIGCVWPGSAGAQGDTAEQLQHQWGKDVVGKTIVYIPVTYNAPLTRIWGQRMQMIADKLGIKFSVRDL